MTPSTTGCVCDGPGYCERHGCEKHLTYWKLCRTKQKYFDMWEAGNGPGQRHGIKITPGPMLRVGLITPTLLFGGAERWVTTLAVGLGDTDLEVSGVAVRDMGQIMPSVAQKCKDRQIMLLDGPYAIEYLAARSDVLIAWGVRDLSMLAQYRGIVVLVGHGHSQWTIDAIQSCDKLYTHCAAVSYDAANSFPDPSIVTVLHNGIDDDRCQDHDNRQQVRAWLGLADEEIALGYLGRISAEKNPLACVHAAAALGPPFRAVWVGGGPGTKTLLQQAQQIAPDMIYREAVNEVGDVFRAIDCFVLASPSEGFSMALTEAWYCGCPVVATPVGATELEDEHGQLYVPVPVDPSPEQLAEAVRRALSPGNASVMERAQQLVQQNYLAVHMCDRWKNYVRSIVSNRNARRVRSKAPGGPGTELAAMLSWFSLRDSKRCKCKRRALQMDAWGPDMCRQRLRLIADWLEEESEMLGLPTSRVVLEGMIKLAIWRARRKQRALEDNVDHGAEREAASLPDVSPVHPGEPLPGARAGVPQ